MVVIQGTATTEEVDTTHIIMEAMAVTVDMADMVLTADTEVSLGTDPLEREVTTTLILDWDAAVMVVTVAKVSMAMEVMVQVMARVMVLVMVATVDLMVPPMEPGTIMILITTVATATAVMPAIHPDIEATHNKSTNWGVYKPYNDVVSNKFDR